MIQRKRIGTIVAVLVLAAAAGLHTHGAAPGPAKAGEPTQAQTTPTAPPPSEPIQPASSEEPAPAAEATPSGHEHHGSAAPPAGKKPSKGLYTTITGEVMDPACYLEAGVKSIGVGHYQCAVNCAKSGQTLAIYDRANDRIYFIAGELPGKNPNDPVMQYIHKLVDVTGTVHHRSGAYGIVIAKVELHKAGAPAPAGASAASKEETK